GEPTTHPKIIEIIELARKKKIRYIMLNTNGLRAGEDEDFVKKLSKFKGRFEIYLQFDGLSQQSYTKLRGKDLAKIKLKAINNLTKYKIPITLVSTIKKELMIMKLVKFLSLD
ncbi:MAG: radical SAM protein, partial [Nanoarchaeota archaeon]|nr:radical SAM protein [Nanoarchaeota archaeon]